MKSYYINQGDNGTRHSEPYISSEEYATEKRVLSMILVGILLFFIFPILYGILKNYTRFFVLFFHIRKMN